MPPDPPENVTVRALTIFVVVTWHLHLDPEWEDDPQGPRTTFHLQYRPEDSQTWRQLPSHISPTQVRIYQLPFFLTHLETEKIYPFSVVQVMTIVTFSYQGQVDVCNLTPNTTYEFQLWTCNRFGKSETVSFIATTLPSFSEMGKRMSAVHSLLTTVSLSTTTKSDKKSINRNSIYILLNSEIFVNEVLNALWSHAANKSWVSYSLY